LILTAIFGVATAPADESSEQLYGIRPTLQDSEQALSEGDHTLRPSTDLEAAERLPHRELDRSEAIDLLSAVFEEQLQGAAGAYDELDVEKFLSTNVAVVNVEPIESAGDEGSQAEGEAGQPNGQTALLESTLPLRAEETTGEKAAVDLSLGHAEGELQSANPLVEVGIPAELGEGIALPEQGVTIQVAGAPEERTPSTVADSTAVYPNVEQDTDLVVAPTPTGVETLTQLRSADAPTSETFNLTLPDGASLQPTEEGGARVTRGGETLLSIPPPSALDADATEVPVSLDVSGNSITLDIQPSNEAAYPILVDPLFDSYNWMWYSEHGWTPTELELERGWVKATNTGAYEAKTYRVGAQSGYRLTASSGWGPDGWVVPGSQANWNYYVPRFTTDYEKYGVRPKTYINKVILASLEFYFNDNPPNPSRRLSPFFQGGIWNTIKGGWIALGTRSGVDGQLQNPYYSPEFLNPNANEDAKNFGIALISNEAGANTERQLSAGQAIIELTENDYPKWGWIGDPIGWVRNEPTAIIPFTVSDTGLGVYKLTVEQPVGPDIVMPIETKQGCVGGALSPCPRSWSSSEEKAPQFNYDPSVMPTGENLVKVWATDPIGHRSSEKDPVPVAVLIKVDHNPPDLALSGSMTEQAKLGTKLPSYVLKATATDGTAISPQSGVAKTFIELDGKVVDQAAPGCTTKNCAISREWTLDASKYSSGSHTVRVTAIDGVGIVTAKTLAIDLNPKVPSLALSGSITEQVKLGASRPRYMLKVNATAEAGGEGAPLKTPPIYAGAFGLAGTGPGQFSHPSDIALDSKGNFWVVDEANNRIQEFNAKQEWIRTVGSKGSENGKFNRPTSIAIDPKGNLWVTDANNRRLEQFDGEGKFLKAVGSGGNLKGQFGEIFGPEGVAIDARGNLWVSDPLNGRVEEFNEKGEYVAQIGPYGTGPGQLGFAAGLDVDRNGNIWVADRSNNRVTEFNEELQFVRQFGAEGTGNGQFKLPGAVTVDAKGGVWVADEGNNRVQQFNEKGEYVTQFGTSGTGAGQFALDNALGIATDFKGNLWVADAGNNRIQEWQASYLPTYRTSFGVAGVGNGQFDHPAGIARDAKGNLWVVDQNNYRVEEFNGNGEYLAKFGSQGTGNGQFMRPTSIAIDPKGNIWVADAGTSRVEKFNEKGEFIGKIGSPGSGLAQFAVGGPEGVDVDGKGNVWVADTYNGRIQKFKENGEFLFAVAPKNPSAGQLGEPTGIDVGPGNNVWVADWQNNKVVEFGEAGQYWRQFGASGTGNGQFSHPDVVVAETKGGVWVGDQNNSRIQGFNEKGEYVTQFGSPGSGKGQFSFGYPMGIAADSKGNFWIADTGNNRVERWSQSNRQSEVATEIMVDGKQVSTAKSECSLDTCPIAKEWELPSSTYSPGAHTVQVKATDGFGQTTVKSLAIEIQRDTVKPILESSGALATAPEGWVEQKSYALNATATDTGYGLGSLVAKIDGAPVASWTGACPDGACKATLAKTIDMSAYSGGAHPAEITAIDGAGNTSKKLWTINVDPDGHVSNEETTDTLEAVETTSPINPIGEAQQEDEYEGTSAGLGLRADGAMIMATNSAAPTTIDVDTTEGFMVEVPRYIGQCGEQALGVNGELSGKEEEELPTGDDNQCSSSGSQPVFDQISVTPTSISAQATSQAMAPQESAVVASNISGSVDLITRPLYDGAMTFAAIRDATAPETYSWAVHLEEGQKLVLLNPQSAAVYYSEGRPAFGITAEPARDAIGTSVPTSLSVTGKEIITLTVAHRTPSPGGGQFIYPVIGGAGWEGGIQTFTVAMPPPEPLPGQEEEEFEGDFEVDGEGLRYGEVAMGPPIADSSAVPLSAQKPAGVRAVARAYNFFECHIGPAIVGVGSPKFREAARGCHGTFDTPNSEAHVEWAVSMSGIFHYKYGHWVWVNEAPDCRKWGEKWEKPAVVHCFASKPNPSNERLDIVSDLRWGEGVWGEPAAGRATCARFDGVLPLRPEDTRPFYGRKHFLYEFVPLDWPCEWGHFPHPAGR
jgi:sugar lactone lactonase YvrE